MAAAHLLLSLLLLLLLSTISLSSDLDTSDSTAVPASYALQRRHLLTSPAPAPSPPTTHHHHHKRHKLRNAIAGFTSGVTAGILLSLLVCLLFRLTLSCIRGRFSNHNDPTIFSPLIKRTEDLAFLQSPDTLASLDIIGRGGCGEVYRKQIDSVDPPRTLAIKKIQCGPDLPQKTRDIWMRQVRSEILTVGRIRHRNLLPLVAHVPRPDCQYLIYEYMKNGSLHDALTDGQRHELDWLSRHKIILGIASGLEYLHHSHKPRIVHRDLKPGNILLDDDMEARIADFGMAKEIPDANTHMTTANVAGTIGYIAPEYYQTMRFTTKCDVYSFGVMLGVLVMGKLPSDPFFQETQEVSLVKWLRKVVASEEAEVAIDPRMRGNGYVEQMLLVARIACFCSAEDPKERPTSKDVRAMLSQIVH